MDRCRELLEQLSQELEFHHERHEALQAENRNLKELHETPPVDKLITSTSINLAASFPPVVGIPQRASQVSFAESVRSPSRTSRAATVHHRRSTGFASESSGTKSLLVRILEDERIHRLAQRRLTP
eukprot:g28448.t1